MCHNVSGHKQQLKKRKMDSDKNIFAFKKNLLFHKKIVTCEVILLEFFLNLMNRNVQKKT